RPAAVAVAEHAEQKRADENADQARHRRVAHLHGRERELADDLRRHDAHDLHVEAVHDQARGAEGEDADLKTADAAVVDRVCDVDRVRALHSLAPHFAFGAVCSARTMAAPITIARIFASATSRGRYLSPQSGA